MKLIITSLIFLILGGSFCQKNKAPQDSLIKKAVNESFDIKLEGCPTCGYSWFLESIYPTKIKLKNKTSIPASGSSNIEGGYAIEIWAFVGLKKGKYKMSFFYKRPWLDTIEKTKTISIIIN